jgi:tetratricopeptide (TPR) repeat protein
LATKATGAIGLRAYATLLVLVALTLFVYAPVVDHQFLSWDDPQYITDNPHVLGGLTWPGVRWAFTAYYASNWHPLTWLSHMADVEWYGVMAGPAHLTNVVMHVATTAVLFLVLLQTTRAWAPSAFVAAMFAVHPLHVESVAWIAERKDVLSTLLWAFTVWAYAIYTRKPGWTRGLAVCGVFVLALLAKPMVVTLPFVLLLLDIWPLGRLRLDDRRIGWREHRVTAGKLVREKVPLFVLAAASSGVTFYAQRQGGAVAEFEALPFGTRMANAVVTYFVYLQKMFWPARLAPFYPYGQTPAPLLIGSALGLLAVSLISLYAARQRPYLLVGWLLYLGTLVPVIGIIQVGSQARADRYTYVPLIGAFIACAWLLHEVAVRHPQWRPALVGAGLLAVAACAVEARAQTLYWRDNLALWQHAVETTATNEVAETGLGLALADAGRHEEAIAHFIEALRINPAYAFAHNDLGAELRRQRQTDEAIRHLSEALRLRPDFPEAANNLGNALADAGRLDEAMARYSDALRLKPEYAEAHQGRGAVLTRLGKWDEAVAEFSEAARLMPDSADAATNLAVALASAGRFEAAAQQASLALRLNPRHDIAQRLLNDLIERGAIRPAQGAFRTQGRP